MKDAHVNSKAALAYVGNLRFPGNGSDLTCPRRKLKNEATFES
jgi:hypothetical protein